jgi:phosphopantothenate-cysteine ligase
MMRALTANWCPRAFVVSFKLETDGSILADKIRNSMRLYGQHMVIGNLLHNYRNRVEVWSRDAEPCELLDTNGSLEAQIVAVLAHNHAQFK